MSDEEPVLQEFAPTIARVMGWPPMWGRMLGVLMLSAEAMTADEIRASTGASAGSVSEGTRALIDAGVIERVRSGGKSRKRYYQWRHDAWVGCALHQLTSARELLELAQRSKGKADALNDNQQERIRRMVEYYDLMFTRFSSVADEVADIFSATGGYRRPELAPTSQHAPGAVHVADPTSESTAP